MRSLESFPRIRLGILPTPIHKLENISSLLGRNIYIKRDDMTGLGLGGNKIRKLEFLLADAKAQGAEVVFTTGGAQSNHAFAETDNILFLHSGGAGGLFAIKM